MAILHRKEEKLQAVLGRLPVTYSDEEFVAMFIQLFSRDWGRIKAAYIKQTQDKEPGTVITMPKPEAYLKQVLTNFLSKRAETDVAASASTTSGHQDEQTTANKNELEHQAVRLKKTKKTK